MLARLLLPLLIFIAPAAGFAAGGFGQSEFEQFVEARAGTGAPVYWYSEGEVRTYPDGKLVARMQGFDTARRAPKGPNGEDGQFSRKIYVFRDPATNAIIREKDGKPVDPIKFTYQHITYKREGELLITHVTQGSGDRLLRIGPGNNSTARRLGKALLVTSPLYLDVKTPPAAARQLFENYDFFLQPGANRLSWLRYGNRDALVGGVSVSHMIGWRVDRFEDLPADMREFVEKEAPLWKTPPRDLAEIRQLQAAPPK